MEIRTESLNRKNECMGPRVYLNENNFTNYYYLVYFDETTVESKAVTQNGNVTKHCRKLVKKFSHLTHGLWDASEYFGETVEEVMENIRFAMARRQ